MAEESRDPLWAEKVAWWTFIVTVVSALLFVGSAIFILRAGGGF
jgi:hypothetical protein